MNILVTGSKGVVGTSLCRELQDRGYNVYGCDLMHSHAKQYFRADIGEYRQIHEVINKINPELIYNTAGEFGRHNGELMYELLWRTNVVGMKNLLRLQETYGFRLVHFSSSEIYGDYRGAMREDVPLRHPIRQLNDYAMSKWVNEMQILNAAEEYQTETVRVRLFNTYGPGEYYTPYRSVIARFCYYALHDMPYTVYLGHKRSFSYIDDTVRTLANIAHNFKPGEVYNIGSTRQYDIKDISDLIQRLSGRDGSRVQYSNSEPLTTTEKKVDTSKAKRDLDHRVRMKLETGIQRTLDWMSQVYRPSLGNKACQ